MGVLELSIYGGNIVQEIRDSTMDEPRLEDVFHVSETGG